MYVIYDKGLLTDKVIVGSVESLTCIAADASHCVC